MHIPLFVLLLFGTGLGTPEIILIALVVLLLFGGRKIPELMKGIGKGVKSFKDGMKGMEDDINDTGKKNPDKPQEPTTGN
jgi:sec-independent protein translocase protein TatA